MVSERLPRQPECLERNVTPNQAGHAGVRSLDGGQVGPGSAAEFHDNPWLYRFRNVMDDVLWFKRP